MIWQVEYWDVGIPIFCNIGLEERGYTWSLVTWSFQFACIRWFNALRVEISNHIWNGIIQMSNTFSIFIQVSMRENLENSITSDSTHEIYNSRVTTPTFYIVNRRLQQESDDFCEHNEVIKGKDTRFLGLRSYTSRSDNRNKLLRESFI